MDTSLDKRQCHRAMQINWPVTIRAGKQSIDGQTENISFDGVCLRLKGPQPSEGVSFTATRPNDLSPSGLSFHMLLRVPDRYPLNVVARIVWVADSESDEGEPVIEIGVQFEKISEGDRKFLQYVIANTAEN